MNIALGFMKIRSLSLAVVIGLVGVFLALDLLGMTSAVLAQEQAGTESMYSDSLYQPPPPNDDDLKFIAFFTDDAPIQITDLSGNILGDGIHLGNVRCNKNKCSQQTALSVGVVFTDPAVFEYKFTTRQALDPEAERVVVSGKGRIISRGGKERFSFTATFQNNGDGTVEVTYIASRPEASFIIPNAPGSFQISSRR